MEYASYKNAIAAVRARRDRAQLLARAAYEQALEDPAFYAAEKAYRAAVIDSATGKGTKAAVKAALAARSKALAAIGLSDADLAPKYACDACQDTGVKDGRPCKCAVDLFIRSARDGVMIPLKKFDDLTPTPFQENAYRILKSYAAKFPATNKRVILLLGGAGVGKTVLAGCVADAVLARGYSVLALSAFGFLNRVSGYHTTFDDSRNGYLQPLLDCDLLIIDDLGTETILKNITREYFYLVVNERNAAGKHTLITTNLSSDDLVMRYGERTASRLFDKNICFAAGIVGKDLRKIAPKQ